MDKVRELKIDSTLWATPSKIVNLLDFKPEKLSILSGFYLTTNLRSYFNFSNNLRTLTLNIIFVDNEQKNKYHQVWKEILKIINGGHGELKLHEKVRLFDNDLPIEHVFKIPTITIIVRSLIEKNNKFYLELLLNHCL